MAGKYEREFDEEETGRLEKSRRGYWANKAEFILACIGNAWTSSAWLRFPFLCYANGGLPVFIIPYAIMLCHVGLPMMLLEMTLGQYSSGGVLAVWWRICPLFGGVGISIVLYCIVSLCYFVPFMSWTVYYLYVSFTSAWLNCDNSWNTEMCRTIDSAGKPQLPFWNTTSCEEQQYTVSFNGYCYDDSGVQVAIHDDYVYQTQGSGPYSFPTEEYFSRLFLREHAVPNMDFTIAWKRILPLAVLWIVIALCVCVGVRSIGKVVYFTSTIPVVLLIGFLIRALTLPGAMEGLNYLFLPDFSRLSQPSTWTAAASEVLFGTGIGYGGYLTLSSYNRFQNFYALDAIIVVTAHILVRTMIAVFVMGLCGFLAFQMEVSISEIMTTGPKVIFSMIPLALSNVPGSAAACFFFFFTVFLMQLGATMPMMEVISTAICDLWRPLLRLRFVLVGILCSAFFLVGILFCTSGGMTIFNILDLHLHPFYHCLIICAMCVCVAVFYGICWTRYDITLMLSGRHICLKIIAGLVLIPAAIHWFLLVLTSVAFLVYSAIEYMQPTSLPWWSQYVGFSVLGVILLPMLVVPIVILIIVCTRRSCSPVCRPESKWGPHLSRFRVRATHLPHINISPLTVEGVKLDRMAPMARYDI